MDLKLSEFTGGRVTDNDPLDNSTRSLRECGNLNLDVGVGTARVREGLKRYDELGPEDGYPFYSSGLGDYREYYRLGWSSGVNPIQRNTMFVYRKYDTTNKVWLDYWHVYTNAVHGGNGFAFEPLLGAWQATDCRPHAESGCVRLATGHEYDREYFVLRNLCENGDREFPYFVAAPPANGYTVDPAMFVRGQYGNGGDVLNGWSWDWGKLYLASGATGNILSMVTFIPDALATAALPVCDLEVMVVPIYDADLHPQFGIGKYFYLPIAASGQGNVQVTVRFSPTLSPLGYNKRLGAFAVYMRRYNRLDGVPDDVDFMRVKWLDWDQATVGAGYDFVVDGNTVGLVDSSWAADSKGRAPVKEGTRATQTFGATSAVTYTPSDTEVDKWIAVRPRGFFMRRQRLYAYGLEEDPGQTQIAVSMPDSIDGTQLDVFYRLNRIWREDSDDVVAAYNFYDRMLLFNRRKILWVDLEQRIEDQTQDLDRVIGSGVDSDRTIAVGRRGVFYANRDGCFKFVSGPPEPLMKDRMLKEWLALPLEYRDMARGFYNEVEDSYWLVVQTQPNPVSSTAANQYTCYVWFDSRGKRYWLTRRFMSIGAFSGGTGFEPRLLWTDDDGKVVIMGNKAGTGQQVYEFGDVAGELNDDDDNEIYFDMETQWLGERSAEIAPAHVALVREIITPATVTPAVTDNHVLRLDLYGNSAANGIYATRYFDHTRDTKVRLTEDRFRQFKLKITGKWKKDGTAKDEIYEIAIDTNDEARRSD